MKHLTLTAVSLLLISLASVSYSQIPALEREALIAFYNSTNGDSWLNPLASIPGNASNPTQQAYLISMLWKTTDWQQGRTDDDVFREAGTECGWSGVTCTNGHVTSLSVGGNHLSGSLPAELGNLTHLTYLRIINNFNSYPEGLELPRTFSIKHVEIACVTSVLLHKTKPQH